MLIHSLEFVCIHKPRAISIMYTPYLSFNPVAVKEMKLVITTIWQSRCSFNYKISFPDLPHVYNMVRVIECKNVKK